MINLRVDRFGLQLLRVRFDSKNRRIRRGDPQLFLISSLAMESIPLGMVKSSVSGQLFFCDCGHYHTAAHQNCSATCCGSDNNASRQK